MQDAGSSRRLSNDRSIVLDPGRLRERVGRAFRRWLDDHSIVFRKKPLSILKSDNREGFLPKPKGGVQYGLEPG
jgi:hypothetical protein